MTKFLASVATTEEAKIALAAKVDIIDLKDPSAGALGAVTDDIVRAVVKLVDGASPVSATIGDLPMEPKLICDAVKARAALGVEFVKIGFPADPNRTACIKALRPLTQNGCRIVAVFFADQPFEIALIEEAKSAGLAGVMLDTAEKSAGSLTNCRSNAELKAFVTEARQHNLLTGLAGSLKADDIPELLALSPDYLGFRGALCQGNHRTSALNPQACATIRAQIPAPPRQGASLSKQAPNFVANL